MEAGIIFISIALGWFILNWIIINRMLKKKVKGKTPTEINLQGFRTWPYPW